MALDKAMLENIKGLRTPDKFGYKKSISDIMEQFPYFFNNSRSKAHQYVIKADELIALEEEEKKKQEKEKNPQPQVVNIINSQPKSPVDNYQEDEDLIGLAVERVTIKSLKKIEDNLDTIIEKNPKAIVDFLVNMLKMYKENS